MRFHVLRQPLQVFVLYSRTIMERITGIEPAASAWEAEVLPLNYIRIQRTRLVYHNRLENSTFDLLTNVKITLKICFLLLCIIEEIPKMRIRGTYCGKTEKTVTNQKRADNSGCPRHCDTDGGAVFHLPVDRLDL